MTADGRVEAIASSDKPNALVVDLVGITGLANCASTVQIYADGLDDEVTELATTMLEEQSDEEGEADVAAVIVAATEIVEAEREERDRKKKEEAKTRSKAGDVGFLHRA